MMIVVKSNKQYLIKLAALTLVNILNCPNGIIRKQYENKLKQKTERVNNESKFKKY